MTELGNHNFAFELESDQIGVQRKFMVAIDSSRRLQSDEIVFLDGALNGNDDEEEEEEEGSPTNSSDDMESFFQGEEVDLSQTDGIVEMDVAASDIDDTDEPYQDSDGVLYYICDKCTFVCIDHATLTQHTNENHPKIRFPSQQRRHRTNNSALRSSDDYENFYSNDSIQKDHQEQTTTAAPFTLPSQTSPSPPASALILTSSSIDIQKPYECEICHKRLSTAANLRGHITTHSDEKPFGCNMCPKRFKQKRHLKYHQKIHNFKSIPIELNPDNEFQLQFLQNDESNESYGDTNHEQPTVAQVLMPKIKNPIHTERQTPSILFQCNQCPKVFTQKSNLYRHQRSHTPIYECDICDKKFRIEQNFHEHLESHGVVTEYLSEQ